MIAAIFRHLKIQAKAAGHRMFQPQRMRAGVPLGLMVVLIGTLTTPAYASNPKPHNLLVLGDSLSAEYGLPRGTGWVALLAQRLKSEHLPYQVINSSISGDTTAGGSHRLPTLLRRHMPVVVIIELGGNDALRGLALRSTDENLRLIIAATRAEGALPLLVGMRVPPNYGKTYSENFEATYARIAKQKRVALVPFLLEGLAENPNYFQADQIHPNQDAQKLMLDNVWPTLKQLLSP